MLVTIEAVNGVPAEKRKFVSACQAIPKFFEPDNSVKPPLQPKQGDHFTEHGNAPSIPARPGFCECDQPTYRLGEPCGVGPTAHKKPGEGFGGVQAHISPGGERGGGVES